MLTFDSIYGYSCEVFQNYFERLNHLHNTRNNNLSLKFPKVRTEFGRKGFYFLGAKAFNDLPLSVRLFEIDQNLKMLWKNIYDIYICDLSVYIFFTSLYFSFMCSPHSFVANLIYVLLYIHSYITHIHDKSCLHPTRFFVFSSTICSHCLPLISVESLLPCVTIAFPLFYMF